MRMRKLASRLLARKQSEREKSEGMEEGPLKECWPTTDSLPKLAKIKQDEKLLGVAVQSSSACLKVNRPDRASRRY